VGRANKAQSRTELPRLAGIGIRIRGLLFDFENPGSRRSLVERLSLCEIRSVMLWPSGGLPFGAGESLDFDPENSTGLDEVHAGTERSVLRDWTRDRTDFALEV
jgi:hypothetical protein